MANHSGRGLESGEGGKTFLEFLVWVKTMKEGSSCHRNDPLRSHRGESMMRLDKIKVSELLFKDMDNEAGRDYRVSERISASRGFRIGVVNYGYRYAMIISG